MITLRRAEDRRHLRRGSHQTWMTFDPENPLDPLRRGFHALRSFTEEHLGPGGALPPPLQEDVEILTYVREGALVHHHGAGEMNLQGPGEFQRSSVSRESRRPSTNESRLESAQIFQSSLSSRIQPLQPLWEKKRFPIADREGILRIVVSLEGNQTSLPKPQNIRVYSSVLLLGQHLIHELGPGRGAWLQVITGNVLLRDHELRAGDGVALEDEPALSFTARNSAEIMLFDLA